MQTRSLGNTGLATSVLGFGAGRIGGLSELEAELLLGEALDSGIRLIDTAPSYERSEERIGRYLAPRRDEFLLVTKLGYGVPGVADWTPECITRGIDKALATLRTDRLDVGLLHSCPRHLVDDEGIREALARALEAGKLGAAGYSGEHQPLLAAIESAPYGVVMASLNLFDQGVADAGLPRAVEHGVGFLAKRPLANAPWRFADRPAGDYCEVYWERMQTLGLDPGNLGWDEFALRFAAFQPGVSTAVVGTTSRQRLRANAEMAARGPLPEDLLGAVRSRFREVGGGWPGQV